MPMRRKSVGHRVKNIAKCSGGKDFSRLEVALEIMNHHKSESESAKNSTYLCAKIKLEVRDITNRSYEVDQEASMK